MGPVPVVWVGGSCFRMVCPSAAAWVRQHVGIQQEVTEHRRRIANGNAMRAGVIPLPATPGFRRHSGTRVRLLAAMERPQTRYVDVGGAEVAYQITGQGPPDLIYVPGWSHIDVIWEEPVAAAFLERLASFSRLILFDQRGSGASDATADAA